VKTQFDTAMARIHYRHVRPPEEIIEDRLRGFEQEIRYSLPADYRTFLKKYGFACGRGDTRFKKPEDRDDPGTSVGVFYGLKAGDKYDLRTLKATFADRLPDHLLPFTSGSGGEFCLSLSGDDAGCVYWWFQETGPVESVDDLEPIADNFTEFINSLFCLEGD
jgi:hypothetical protein